MRCSQVVLATVAAAVVAFLDTTAFAQSSAERHESPPTLLVAFSAISADPVRVYDAETAALRAPAEIPSNLTVSKHLKPVVEMMLQRSALFRRQCLRIAGAPFLTVTIGSFHPLPSEHANAKTTFIRRSGALLADVRIAPLTDQVKLIAHEIEHVIEQLDGIDLRTHASLRGAAASVCEDGSFETVRAVRKGLAVAREMDEFR